MRVIPEEKEVQTQTEKMMVAFGRTGTKAILACAGETIEFIMSECADEFLHPPEREDGFTTSDPDHGIWIWEGQVGVEISQDWESGIEEVEYYTFDDGRWRMPTVNEMAKLLKGEDVWESQWPPEIKRLEQ